MRFGDSMDPEIRQIVVRAVSTLCNQLTYRNYVLSFSHSNYLVRVGGTEKLLHEEQAELQDHAISYIQISPFHSKENFDNPDDDFPVDPFMNQVVCVNVDSAEAGRYTLKELAAIIQVLSGHEIAFLAAVHVHHLLNFSIPGVTAFLSSLSFLSPPSVRFFIHDFYTVCPQIFLMQNGRIFCGGPERISEVCEACKWCRKRKIALKHIRHLFHAVPAEFIIPSESAAAIWKKNFPEMEPHIQVVPHQRILPVVHDAAKEIQMLDSAGYRPRIAYLGYEGFHKGTETWCRLISTPEVVDRYEWFHLGSSGMQLPQVTYIPVSFIDHGANAMIAALRAHRIDIAFLWSLCSETYSFTFFEAIAANCLVVTNSLSGNIAAQVKKMNRGIVFNDELQLIYFLKNVSSVKKKIQNNLQDNSPCELVFNPEIALAIAESIPVEQIGVLPGRVALDKKIIQSSRQDMISILHREYAESAYVIHLAEQERLYQTSEKNLKADMDSTSERLDQVAGMLRQRESDISWLQGQVHEITLEKQQRESDVSWLQNQIVEIRQQYRERENDISWLQDQLNEVRQEKGQREDDILWLKSQIHEISHEKEQRESDISWLQNQLNEIRQEKGQREDDILWLKNQIFEISREKEQRESDIMWLQSLLQEVQQQKEANELQLQTQLQEVHLQKEADILQLQAQLQISYDLLQRSHCLLDEQMAELSIYQDSKAHRGLAYLLTRQYRYPRIASVIQSVFLFSWKVASIIRNKR